MPDPILLDELEPDLPRQYPSKKDYMENNQKQ